MVSSALVRLADKSLNKEFEELGSNLPSFIADALKEELEAENKKASAEVAREILGYIRKAKSSIDNSVIKVRSLRHSLKIEKAYIKQIERAHQYGMETNNWIPLAFLLGEVKSGSMVDSNMLVVPDSWEPKNSVPVKEKCCNSDKCKKVKEKTEDDSE